MWWFLSADVLDRMDACIRSGVSDTLRADLSSRFGDMSSGERIYSVKNGVATITIDGVLTNKPDIWAMILGYGNTTYEEIVNAAVRAQSDDEVERVDFAINSPGGSVAGFYVAQAALAGITKPTRSIVGDIAASGGYGLATAGDEIVATHGANIVGSVGVVRSYLVEKDVVEVTSTNAPNKRPDPTTDEGKAVIRAELDQIEDQFIDVIATGRGVSKDTVKEKYGRGGTMVAEKALALGMIDAIVANQDTQTFTNKRSDTRATNQSEATKMDKEELKAKYPALFAEVVAIGAEQERERVEAHLEMASIGGEKGMEVAREAIVAGEGLTPKLQAKYTTAAHAHGQQSTRDQDENELDGKPAGNTEAGKQKDQETLIHEAILNGAEV